MSENSSELTTRQGLVALLAILVAAMLVSGFVGQVMGSSTNGVDGASGPSVPGQNKMAADTPTVEQTPTPTPIPNEAPTFSNSNPSLTVNEDASATSINSLLTASDDDDDTLTWTDDAAPSDGSLSGFDDNISGTTSNGVDPSGLAYQPNADFDGSDSFDVQVSDGNGETETVTVSVTVQDAPEVSSITRASPTSQNTNADSVTYDVTFSESVSGVGTSDFTVTHASGDASGSVASVGSSSGTTITVTVDSITGDGDLRLDLSDDDSITNGNGVPLGGDGTTGSADGSYTSGQTYTMAPDGDGTVNTPYEITDWNELSFVREDLDANYSLEADLDENTAGYDSVASASTNSNKGFDPIGSESANFTGTFDGNNHTISDLTIDRPSENFVGLFENVSDGATISHTTLKDASVNGELGVGGLVGLSRNGTVTDSSVAGDVSGGAGVGGLVGIQLDGRIDRSAASGSVTVDRADGDYLDSGDPSYGVGGLVGANGVVNYRYFHLGVHPGGTIVNSTANASVDLAANNISQGAGGLVGVNYRAPIEESTASGDVVSKPGGGPDFGVGGLAGINVGNVSESESSGDVSGSRAVGGLVGIDAGRVTDSHATGNVSGLAYTGGLVGVSVGEETINGLTDTAKFEPDWFPDEESIVGPISNSSASGVVTGTGTAGSSRANLAIGGLVGANGFPLGNNPLPGVVIENSSASGRITIAEEGASGTMLGGLVGVSVRASIDSSRADVAVTDVGQATATGGLVGFTIGSSNTEHTIADSVATGAVTGSSNVGGLVGANGNKSQSDRGMTIEQSTASGAVNLAESSTDPRNIGGLIGQSYLGTVTQSNATGDVNGGNATNVGGLVGYTNATESKLVPKTIRETYATGAVDGSQNVGGLVGKNVNDLVTDSYATGSVNGSSNVGSLVGSNTGTNAKVDNSYANGSVSGEPAGGLVGTNANDATVADAYWDTETTGQSSSASDATGLTTSQLKGNTSLAGFDFATTWDVRTGSEVSYPYLQKNTQTPAPGLETVDTAPAPSTSSPDPADFDITVDTPTTVTAGDEISINVTVDNTGGQSDRQTIPIRVNGRQHNTSRVSLDEGATESLTVTYPTSATDVGALDISVTSDDDIETATVTVAEAALTADAGIARTAATNTTVRFDGANSTGTLGITSYEWDFGDGTTATGATPTHAFADPGNYTVELTVTDQSNRSDTDTTTVIVTDPADPTLALQSASGPVALPVNSSRTTTVTVTNNGTTTRNLTGYTVTGPDADSFSVVSAATPVTVAGGQTRSLTVRAADNATGNRTATLTVSTDHPGQPTLATSLAATVREPEPTLRIQSDDTETPSLPVNSSTTITRLVTNDGEIDWTVTDVAVTGADTGSFEVRSPTTPATIASAETLAVDVQVTPTTPGNLTGTLQLSTDNPAQPTVNQSITVERRESLVSFAVPGVTFDATQPGTSESLARNLSVRNTVNRTVTIQNVTVTGSGADRFSLGGTGSFDIAPGETHTLTVRFDPEINETSTATLRVTPSDGGPPSTLTLNGTGGSPSPSLGVDSATFENVSLGETRSLQRVPVTNDGTAPLRLDQNSITGPDASAFSVTNDTLEVPPGETRSVGLRYQPSGTQPQRATLVLAGPHARTTLPLSGTPSFSRAEINTSSLYFGEQAVNETTTRQFTITNPAGAKNPLGIESRSVTGQNADEFTTSIGTQTLRPGEQTTVDVTLSPDSPGTKTGLLKVVTNSPVDPQLDVWLSNSRTIITVERVSDGNTSQTDTDTPDGNATDGESGSTVQVTGRNIPEETHISVNVSQPETRRSEAALDVVDTTLEGGGNFSMNISHRQQPTAGVPAFDATNDNESLRYVEVTHSFSNAEVSNNSFLVRVSKTRMQQQDIDPETVVMNRYHDGEWQRLPARMVRETKTHRIYQVGTPGFSTFAVTAPVPELSVETASLNRSEIRPGEAVTVTATVRNNGTAEGTMTVPLTRNGTTVASRNVTVGAESVETVSFVTRPDAVGSQTLTVGSTMAGTVSVQAETGSGNETTPAATATATPGTTAPTGEPASGDGGDGSLTAVVIVLLVLIGGGVMAWWFRQRENEE